MSNKAIVYWIHHPEHTDILTQGYVGFTKQSFKIRSHSHKKYARQGKKYPISRAIRKHGWDNLSKSIICIGSPEYCLTIERKLRPLPSIGWNAGTGGGAAFLGKNHTEESRSKMRAAMKGIPKSAEAKINIGLAQLGRIHTDDARRNMSVAGRKRVVDYGFTDEHRANISKARKGVSTNWKKWMASSAKSEVWIRAEEIYAAHLTGSKRIKIPNNDAHTLCRMRRHFSTGWNPLTDLEYQLWKKSKQ